LTKSELDAGATDKGVLPSFPIATTDILLAAALFVAAFSVRRNLPSDGLFYDDAWQAFGVAKASLSQWYTVGQSQPGFTFVMIVWTRVFGDGSTSMVTPALIAGSIGPPTLYLTLRRFRHARSTALLVGAMLSASTTDIVFSTRAKSYTTDVLVVLVLALILPHFAERRWGIRTAIAWVGCAVIISSVAAIAPLATIAAGLTLAVHPRGDRQMRTSAIGVQVAVSAIYVLLVLRTYNDKLVRGFLEHGRCVHSHQLEPDSLRSDNHRASRTGRFGLPRRWSSLGNAQSRARFCRPLVERSARHPGHRCAVSRVDGRARLWNPCSWSLRSSRSRLRRRAFADDGPDSRRPALDAPGASSPRHRHFAKTGCRPREEVCLSGYGLASQRPLNA